MINPFQFSPKAPFGELGTLLELKTWMVENGCNFQSYQIDSGSIAEGYILETEGDSFVWKYTERGKERVVHTFENECDAVTYAFKQINGDVWAWCHMVGFLKSKVMLTILKIILRYRNVVFYEDAIPYGGRHDLRYRVYVHGRDASLVADLRKPFGR